MMFAHTYTILQNKLRLLGCLLCLIIVLAAHPSQAQLSGYTIVCGQTTQGQPINCDTSIQRCVRCKNTRGWFAKKTIYYTYNCISREAAIPRNCETSNSGGLTGESDVKIFGLKKSSAHQQGQNCITANLMAMYSSTCYSCEIVETLISAFIRSSAKAYEVSREAGNAILVVGMILWIALFVLKNISSFTTVEPMKMLQDLLLQFFKIFLAFVIVNSGIPTILHYTMEPLMMAGTDLGDAILNANVGVNRELTNETQSDLSKQKEQENQQKLEEFNRQLNALDGNGG